MTERAAYRGLVLCLFLSGAAGLVYEVAWVRSLELVFGATTFAVATVLAAFMGGLAAGSAAAGRLAHRFESRHPLRVYALLEAALAVAALLVPIAFRALLPASRLLFRVFGERVPLFVALRFFVCAAVLLVPTALMGATLPVVSRFAAGFRDEGSAAAAGRMGTLFAINTFGAVLGCAAAGFVFLPRLGLLGTQWLAVTFNLGAAAIAWGVAHQWHAPGAPPPAPADAAPGPPAAFAAAAADRTAAAAPRARLLIGAYALSGAVAMVSEVAWSRFLVLVLGSSTYAYTVMLATFLLGLAAGAWAGTRVARSGADAPLAAGASQLWIAATTFLGLFVAAELPYLDHLLYDAIGTSPAALLLAQAALAACVMAPPTLGMGAMFPITLGGLGLTGRSAPRSTARAYAWNTTGAIAGSVLAGFALVPLLGTRRALLTAVVTSALAGAACILGAPRGALRRGWRPAVLAAAGLFLVDVALSSPEWRVEVLGSGLFRYADRYRGLDRKAFYDRLRQSHGEFLFFDEGTTATVSVFRTTQAMTLLVNGKPDASVPPGLPDPRAAWTAPGAPAPLLPPPPVGDLPTQVLIGQLPLLLAPRGDDVLLIGLGSGVTLGSILTHPVGRVDCLEIEGAVVRASRLFDRESGAPLRDPRVHLMVNDARNDLMVRERDYDVVVSEPSNPWIAGASSLFTRELFQAAARRLRPGGLFCQWIQLYELWPEDFESILRGFLEVFPSAQVWRVGPDALVLAGREPIPLAVARVYAHASEAAQADLARIGIHGPEELLAHFWIGGDELRAAVPAGPVNTDDNMRIEFAAPLRMLVRDAERLQAQRRALSGLFAGRSSGVLPHLVFPDPGPGPQAAFLARLAAAALDRGYAAEAAGYATRSLALDPQPGAALARAAALAALGREDEAAAARAGLERDFPEDAGVRRALLAAATARGDRAAARRQAETLVRISPDDDEARLRLAEIQVADGERARAAATLEPLVRRPGADPPADRDGVLGRLLEAAGRSADAVAPLRRVLERHPADRDAAAALARALRASGDTAGAESVERRLRPDAPEVAAARLDAAGAALDAGRLKEARALLLEAREFAPDQDAVLYLLARTLDRSGDRAGAVAVVEEALRTRTDRPWAVGYLTQLLAEEGRAEEASTVAARYRALTGSDWTPIGP